MGQAPAHDLHPQAQRGGGPAHQPALVGGIAPEQPDAAEAHAQPPQQCAGGVTVLDAGGGDQHDQQQLQGVHRDVALAAVDLLGGVVAAAWLGDGLGGADRLGVNDRRRGGGLAAVGLADLLAEGVVDPAQGAVGGPAGEVAVDGGPGWEISGQRAPDAAVVDQVADGVDDLPAGWVSGRPPVAGCRLVGAAGARSGPIRRRWCRRGSGASGGRAWGCGGAGQGTLAAGLLVGSLAWSP